jgi:osmotically inducible lipoprotein OsmB
MKNKLLFLLMAAVIGITGCTNMSHTQQGALSGAAIGAGAGLGISALTGGSLGVGALLGGALGGLGGAVYGHEQERRHYQQNY